MQKGFIVFIAMVSVTVAANAVSVRGVSTARRSGTEQIATPVSSYNYNYMYPYLNNQMRTTLNPGVTTSQSTSPINAVVRTEPLSAPRRVVPRPTSVTTSNAARVGVATNTGVAANNQRRVVARPQSNNGVNIQATIARNVSRNQNPTEIQTTTTKVTSSARCLADYTECMNDYCERANTAYNRCYCSAKLSQIDATYQPQIEALVNQIIALQSGGSDIDVAELNAYWAQTVAKYTGDNSLANLENALDIDWASMESRVRGQNAFITGHEYCVQHLQGCFYMASNLRDAYRSSIASDCAKYEAGLERLKTVAESVVEAYQE